MAGIRKPSPRLPFGRAALLLQSGFPANQPHPPQRVESSHAGLVGSRAAVFLKPPYAEDIAHHELARRGCDQQGHQNPATLVTLVDSIPCANLKALELRLAA
jgi:hypothetical protein